MKPFEGEKDCYSEIAICNPIYEAASVRYYRVGLCIFAVLAFYVLQKDRYRCSKR
jgi:hypothetical protein